MRSRRSTRVLVFPAVVVALAASLVQPTGAVPGGPAGPGDGGAVQGAPPDIVLILADDQRWDMLEPIDGRHPMPILRSRLIDRGVWFTRAMVVNALCCPSRASILTGSYSHRTGLYRNAPPNGGFASFDDRRTMATVLRGRGYRTALLGKYLNGYGQTNARYVPPGWDRWVAFVTNGGNGDYFDYSLSVDGAPVSYGSDPADYSTDVLAGEAEGFIRGTEAGRPLFLLFSPRAPHEAAIPAPRHEGAFADLAPHRPPNFDEADVSDKPAHIRALPPLDATTRANIDQTRIDQYETMLAVDDAIERITDALEETGRLSNTIIAYVSDNGYAWGEHRWVRRKAVPYEESIRVPMVVRYDPLTVVPRTDDHLVANIDLAPTFADLAGLPVRGVDGRSLVPLLSSPDPPWRSDLLVEHALGNGIPTYCAVRSESHLYVRYDPPEEELYDLAIDPYQLENRAGDPAYASILEAHRARMFTLCDPPPPADMTLSAYPQTATIGRPVTLSGALLVPITGTEAGQTIALARRNPDGSTTVLPAATTDENGRYTAVDTPPAGGPYRYGAAWAGDEAHAGTRRTVSVAVVGFSATADFDGDSFVDVAVGVPGEAVGSAGGAGAVSVIYGSPAGLASAGNQLWTQNSPNVAGTAEAGDGFGTAVGVGDFNGDGYADLAVGVPGEDVGTVADGGAVHVLLGSPQGLTATGSQLWTQDSPGVADSVQAGDGFGSSLATGDFDGDGRGDLAVGVPYEDVGTRTDAGGVTVLRGSVDGLTGEGGSFWSQDSPGIGGTAEAGDRFGWAVAAGNFGFGVHTDLAVGAPNEDVGRDGTNYTDAGAVNVLYGSADGLTADGNEVWTQDSPGMLNVAEFGDGFGFSLAAARFVGGRYLDLAIGVPFEDWINRDSAGGVAVIHGSPAGLTSTRDELWTQDSEGMLDDPEPGDQFGYAVAAADFDGSGVSDLAVGVPGEETTSAQDSGAVAVIFASRNGLDGDQNQLWTQSLPGMQGIAEAGDRFGSALSTGHFTGTPFAALAVGVPDEDVGVIVDAGSLAVLYGGIGGLHADGNQLWTQGVSGLLDAAETGDRYGRGLSGGVGQGVRATGPA